MKINEISVIIKFEFHLSKFLLNYFYSFFVFHVIFNDSGKVRWIDKPGPWKKAEMPVHA